MLLDFDNKGYDIKESTVPLFSQLALSGFSRGITLNVQVVKMTEKFITIQTYIADTKIIDTKSPAYICLVDQFNGATKEEQRNWQQFGTNAVRYEYIVAIRKATAITDSQFNYELRLEIQRKRENLCKL